MKVRMIYPIGEKISILFKDEKVGTVLLPKLYPLNTQMKDIKESIEWKELEKKYGEWLGWGMRVIYDTESGNPEPGDMFLVKFNPEYSTWENDNGEHLNVILPNGIQWDIDSRAVNCSMSKDKKHRCWIRKGIPPMITVGKNGFTCQAGGGSIKAGDYHGFLKNGEFTK